MCKIIVRFSLYTACLWLVLAGSADADTVCFQCHDKAKFTGEVVHKPVSQSQCGTCHNPHVARYKGLLNTREDKLCYSCHKDQEAVYTRDIVHDPVTGGNCSACHTPHVSSSPGLVRDNLADDCFTCHEKLPREYPVTHKPFADGQCTACHKPHQADNLDLLADSPDKLCESCHDRNALLKSHQGYPGTLRDCLSCHSPHGSDRDGLVRNILHKPYEEGCTKCHGTSSKVGTADCLDCHEEVRNQMLRTRSHLTLHDGNSCLSCHSPHAGDTPSLLKSGERQVCTTCHEDTLAGYATSTFKHPDIKKCSNCHESHGSSHLSFLKGDGNDVCIECHKTQGKFSHPVGPEVFDLRTGQTITCVTCHKPMGTEYQYHLVLDGKEELCVQCHLSY